ncbi:MAG: type II toxin-antitoxin system HicB family antitoxin [Syntrophomonadaceae bacterium]|jgi:antitoxin HicB|nr:type II toxin-antitoxin system HicB family antitoxin [Syntrophomonadaceae bacterium]
MNDTRDIEFYLEQEYPIMLKRLTDEDGGGWLAEIPDLPGCMSDGETQHQALENIEDAKLAWLEIALKRGQNIPLPEEGLDSYSGKFTLRIPKTLHRELAQTAKKEGVSLNQYIQYLLSYNFGGKASAGLWENHQVETADIR